MRQRSSTAELRFCKPGVVGSNPTVGFNPITDTKHSPSWFPYFLPVGLGVVLVRKHGGWVSHGLEARDTHGQCTARLTADARATEALVGNQKMMAA